jgi:hypothetical protein
MSLHRYGYVNNNPLNRLDYYGYNDVMTYSDAFALSVAMSAADGPLPVGEIASGVLVVTLTAIDIYLYITSDKADVKDETNDTCEQVSQCIPPEGTICYEDEPHTTHTHGDLESHYHMYQMQKIMSNGKCFWRYLGGKIGVGVVETPPAGVLPCSMFPNFQGRK